MQTGARSGTGGARLADGSNPSNVAEITSVDGSVTINNPNGPVVDLSVNPLGMSLQELYVRRAASYFGILPSQLAWEFSDWGQTQFLGVATAPAAGGWNTGAVVGVSGNESAAGYTKTGGLYRSQTNAALLAEVTQFGQNAMPGPVDVGAGLIAFRLRFDTDANVTGAMLRAVVNAASNRYMSICIDSAFDATMIAFKYDGFIGAGTQVNLLVNDNLFHVYELRWNLSGTVHVFVDNVEIGAGYVPAIPIQSSPRILFENYNGATAVSQIFSEDWFFQAAPRIP